MLLRVIFLVVLVCTPLGAQAQALVEDTTLTATAPLEAPSDSLIAQRLRSVFAEVEAFQDVRLRVRNGVVLLSGTTPRAEAADRAAELAGRFEGVVYVENAIEADTEVESRVAPAVQKVQEFVTGAVELLPVIAVALVVLLLFWLASQLVRRWQGPWTRMGMSPLLASFVSRVAALVLFLAGLVLALDILDVTALVGAVVGTAGVAGIAIGFAFQDIVQNYLAGALMSIRRPFSLGDFVQINEHQGAVLRLTARDMILMTLDGNHVRLPNATVFGAVITNYTQNPRRRFDFIVGVGVEEDLPEAMRVGRETLEAQRGVMDDPAPFALVEELGDSNVVVRFHGWVDQREADFLKTRSEAVRLVKTALDEAGIELPEPIYRLQLRHEPPAPSEEAAERPTTTSALTQAAQADVSPQRDLDAQIAEDQAKSDEPNLLDEGRRGA